MKRKITPLEIFFSIIIVVGILFLITLMFLEIRLYSQTIIKKQEATMIASNILENMKTRNYEDIESYINNISSIGISKTLENNIQNIIISGKEFNEKIFGTEIPEDYDVIIRIENSSEEFNLFKNVSIAINYKISNKDENVSVSTTIQREDIYECNRPIINDQYFSDLNMNTVDYDIVPIKYSDNKKCYITTTKDDNDWFNYSAKRWAIVLVFSKNDSNIKNSFIDENGNVKSNIYYNNSNINLTDYMYIWIPNFSIKDNIAYFRYATEKRCIRMSFFNVSGKYLYLNRLQEEIKDISEDCSFDGIYGVWRKLGDNEDEYYKNFNLTKFAPIKLY